MNGSQHGLREGAGRPDLLRVTHARTEPPALLETTLGILSYTELAPLLGASVSCVLRVGSGGGFSIHPSDEDLLLLVSTQSPVAT